MARVRVKNVKIGDVVRQPGGKVLKIEKNVIEEGNYYSHVLCCPNKMKYRFTNGNSMIEVMES